MRSRSTNAAQVPLLDTNPQPPGEYFAKLGEIVRMKVQSLSPGGNTNLVMARLWDGTSLGAADIPVVKVTTLAVGGVFEAYRPVGGTTETHSSLRVPWKQLATALPPGAGRYKVLMILDDLNPGTVGWDFPRFHL